MNKKVLVLGVGAQGSAAAKKLDEEPGVSEIVCADYDNSKLYLIRVGTGSNRTIDL